MESALEWMRAVHAAGYLDRRTAIRLSQVCPQWREAVNLLHEVWWCIDLTNSRIDDIGTYRTIARRKPTELRLSELRFSCVLLACFQAILPSIALSWKPHFAATIASRR